ncbi:hypothetical protein EJ06DRAFT_532733 [Trichodelitschia bisporula]|uniref:Uncharacterized protein n=1 Tax=Trichodelitschia bisporula TaxID=703511 RepID=A0A6G1HPA3_9PEZI|nr:hypothetical protein EJ06DRAFT_532733 [Trichodelitschia bisporula]
MNNMQGSSGMPGDTHTQNTNMGQKAEGMMGHEHHDQSTNQSHAKGGGAASIVPQKIQEKLPEKIERAVPNAIHDTGDTGGLHRKQ